MKDTVTYKNLKTGKTDVITRHDIQIVDWGIIFFVDSELDAYKCAYKNRHNQHGVEVRYTVTNDKWHVTYFNELGAKLGFGR